jgi:hypothetical protein
MRFTKTIATALAVTVGALSFAGTSEARERYRHWRPNHGGWHHGGWYHNHRYYNDYAVGAGIFGFAAGALVGSALSRPYYYAPAPAPVYVAPAPAVTYGYQPWTPAWYSYCDAKYRSFNPRTGYFLGYDGDYHFCR